MMNFSRTVRTLLIFILMVFVTGGAVFAGSHLLVLEPAENLEAAEKPESMVKVEGSANVTNWSARSNDVSGTVAISPDFWSNEDVQMVEDLADTESNPSVWVEIPARSLKSGDSGLDKNMHKYLRAEDHPTITYELSTAAVEQLGDTFTMQTTGVLTVGGVSSDVSFPAEVEVHEDYLTVSGSVEAKMTDFDIKPPTAMFGAIRAYDEITLSFEWHLTPAGSGDE